MTSPQPMIVVDHICKSFGGIHAVDDCSLAVERGSITGLIGPNGAGKTTLFNIIAGNFVPNSGHIYVDEQDVTGRKPHELFAMGLVRTFQIPHEFSRMTVLENLMVVPAKQKGESLVSSIVNWARIQREEARVRQQAEEVLNFLRLDRLAFELAGNLSGGQKKLLELGRAMMTEARVVLLDEPGAGVNRTLLADLVADIERLNRDAGYTFFVIEHDMDMIARLCEPVIVMAEGRVLFQGSMDEVRKNDAVVEAYLGSAAEPAPVAG